MLGWSRCARNCRNNSRPVSDLSRQSECCVPNCRAVRSARSPSLYGGSSKLIEKVRSSCANRSGQGDDSCRVDAAAQKHTNGDVTNKMMPD